MPMKLKLHHVNFCTTSVPEMTEFYRTVLGLEDEPALQATRVVSQGYPGKVGFVTDGHIQIHLAEKDLGVAFRTGHAINLWNAVTLHFGPTTWRLSSSALLKREFRSPITAPGP